MSDDDRATMTTTLEIVVVSAEGLDKYSSSSSYFITLVKLPNHAVCQHDGGGGTREHMFRVPVDPTFFSDRHSCLHLQLYNKRRIVGPTQLGWCLIPVTDIGLLPHDSVRYLSYRLRTRDGSRSHVIINLSVRLQGSCSSVPWLTSPSLVDTVIGIPVTAARGIGYGDCNSSTRTTRRGHWKVEKEL
ncbi:uncharacterized protein LOC133284301 [Gastrolobium bilobum]|uniref:uncharacterized protein LOC133284301 n=1 Tax=Gastrolobium bilobum TaxID=150636 RepID=UPI002AB2147E|nr:uncharacterized protein LOC133284301 [Gastrolobium bilobum]